MFRSNLRRLSAVLATAAVSVSLAAAVPASASAAQPVSGLDARTAALYLTQLAPSGRTVGGYQGQQSDDEVYVGYRLDRGAGPVQLSPNVQGDMFDADEAKAFYRCDREAYRTCEVKTDVDGSYLLRATKKLPRGGIAVEADLLRGDGTRVVVLTGNTADSKNGGAVHGRGVTVKDATAIVQSEIWQLDTRPSTADRRTARQVIRPWTLLP